MSSFRGRNGLTFRTDFPGRLGAILPGGLRGFLITFGQWFGFDLSWGLKLS